MKLTTYKQKDSMIRLLIASILFFTPLGGFADEKQKAEKDGLKIFEELDDYALKGWEEMDQVDLQMRLKWYGLFWRPKIPGRFMMRS